jgi:dipeptidase E
MSKGKSHIIAMGGGGLSTEQEIRALYRYVLAQAPKRNPSVCFLPTASGDADTYIAKFYAAFTKLSCRPTHVTLFGRTPNLKEVLLAQDIIYVGGGNTKSMLAVWQEWNIPALLRRAWRSGVVLAGVSAGAICWFRAGVTDSWAGRLEVLPCLGFLPGTCCPHYDGEPERRPAVHRLVKRASVQKVLALDDGVAAHFAGRRLVRIVSSRPAAQAYEVHYDGSTSVEVKLRVTRLPKARTL